MWVRKKREKKADILARNHEGLQDLLPKAHELLYWWDEKERVEVRGGRRVV